MHSPPHAVTLAHCGAPSRAIRPAATPPQSPRFFRLGWRDCLTVAREETRLSDPYVDPMVEEEFKPRGTIAVVAIFVATLILLWLSIYLILIARGVTV